MKISKKSVVAFLTVLTVMCIPFVAFGQWDTNPGGSISGSELTDATFSEILTRVLRWMLAILAILAVIAFVVSGIFYITAGGGERAETAKGWLLGSIIGLVIALLGYVIVITIDNIIAGQ